MEYFFVFFCTCRRMERLLEYSINAYKLFFLGQFLWYFSCVFCRYDQYFRRNWTIGREFWSVLLQMERQMFEYSQLSREFVNLDRQKDFLVIISFIASFEPFTIGDSFQLANDKLGNWSLWEFYCIHSVWKSPKKSHSTLQAKRATFRFWVDKS